MSKEMKARMLEFGREDLVEVLAGAEREDDISKKIKFLNILVKFIEDTKGHLIKKLTWIDLAKGIDTFNKEDIEKDLKLLKDFEEDLKKEYNK